ILTASSEVDPHSPYHSGYDGSPGSGAYAYQDSPEMIHTSSSSARQSTSSSHFHNANPSVMPSASPSMISYISAPSHSMLPASLSSTIREERVYASKTLCSPQVKRDRARSDKEEVSALLERKKWREESEMMKKKKNIQREYQKFRQMKEQRKEKERLMKARLEKRRKGESIGPLTGNPVKPPQRVMVTIVNPKYNV
ncbi:hypothetical protein ADUPG1_013628, partial [Aduncisulcus paluster]